MSRYYLLMPLYNSLSVGYANNTSYGVEHWGKINIIYYLQFVGYLLLFFLCLGFVGFFAPCFNHHLERHSVVSQSSLATSSYDFDCLEQSGVLGSTLRIRGNLKILISQNPWFNPLCVYSGLC